MGLACIWQLIVTSLKFSHILQHYCWVEYDGDNTRSCDELNLGIWKGYNLVRYFYCRTGYIYCNSDINSLGICNLNISTS